MEVDHFDPRLKRKLIQDYSNLFLASPHCNRSKRDTWPTAAQLRGGIRFLNPCEEHDYGIHIFEDSETHELIGVTPAGKWQIRVCGLNANHLIDERRRRAQFKRLLVSEGPIQVGLDFWQCVELSKVLREETSMLIPEIPAPQTPS